jgi:hypothetical protein
VFQDIELPNSFTSELKDLLESLLQREVDTRLGCMGRGYGLQIFPLPVM